jgi:hypothetical protein
MSKIKILERRHIWSSIYGDLIAEGDCYYCIRKSNKIRLDNYEIGHIEAKSKDGSEHPDNKLPICRDCNSSADNGTKFMDLGRYHFPLSANHPHNPHKVYIIPYREYKPMDSNIQLILENSILDAQDTVKLNNAENYDKPVPYSLAKYISDYRYPSWEYMFKNYRKWGKIIIEPIGDFDINILNPQKHNIPQKEYEIEPEEEEEENKDLQIAERYELIQKYTRKTRGELNDDDIQYIIDYLWDLWIQEHNKYGTINNVTLSGTRKNRKIEYRNKA